MSDEQEQEALAEVDAAVQFANMGLQALLDMLAGCDPSKSIRAMALRTLLLPLADQLVQVVPLTQALLSDAEAMAS